MAKEIEAAQVTLTSGKLRRRFTLDKPPIPKVGDIVKIKGEGAAEWSVAKVKPLDPDKIFSQQPDELTRLRARIDKIEHYKKLAQLPRDGQCCDPWIDGWIGALIEENESLRKQIAKQGWQPIESAPKDGTNVLTWHMGGIATMAFLSKEKYGRDPGGWYFLDKWRHWSWCQPTPKYWRPLPDPPIDRAMEKSE